MGENTGTLPNCLEQFARQLERKQTIDRMLKKACRYPLFLFVIIIIFIIVMMLLFVLPQFTLIYQQFNSALPWITQSLITTSKVLYKHGVLLFFLLCCFSGGIAYLGFRNQKTVERFILVLPYFKHIMISSQLATFFQTLKVTQQFGIPLITALNNVRSGMKNKLYIQSLYEIQSKIEQGKNFSEAIQQVSFAKLFPPLCAQLINVGEESGKLEQMLGQLSQYYYDKNLELTDSLIRKIEPIMMSIMAGIIGIFITAIYLPFFELGNVIQ